jgi:phage shock protein C
MPPGNRLSPCKCSTDHLAHNLRWIGHDRHDAAALEFETMTDTHDAAKKDNLFGICNALGEDLGINPLWPRLLFATTFIFDPAVVIVSYFALGAIILCARIAFPRARRGPAAEVIALPVAPAEKPVELARAA